MEKMEQAKTAIALAVLLAPEQVAEILGVTPSTLAVWRCERRYPLRYVKVGTKVRYRARDVEQFINSRVVGEQKSR